MWLWFTAIYLFDWFSCLFKKNPSIYRQISLKQKTPKYKNQPKPQWVINKVIYFKAIMPDAGCRTLALIFNRQFGHKETVSKSWVSNTIRKYRYQVTVQRRRIKNKPPYPCDIDKIWGMDLTGKHDVNQDNHNILGIVDHGSRACICLRALKDKSSATLLRLLLDSIEKYGKPQSIRTDNEAVFTSKLFCLGSWLLGIQHQKADLHCPWQNGRIERFFGTLKSKLNQITIANSDELNIRLKEFRLFYNHIRPHQNLQGTTPAEAWTGKVAKPRAGYFSSWCGLLTGFYHPPDG